jgi:signal transduction histidine kinase
VIVLREEAAGRVALYGPLVPRIALPPSRDALFAGLLLLLGELQVVLSPHLNGPRAGVAVLTLLVVVVAWGRTAPVAAIGVIAVGHLASVLVYGSRDSDFIAAEVVALLTLAYCAGAYEPRRDLSAAGLLLMLAAFWFNDLRQGNPPAEFLASATLTVGPWIAGRLVARAHHQAAALRAANAELVEQRAQAREAAAAAERARIARELHDIVAHSLSVIALQADAAGALVHIRPDDAERAVDAVRHTAQGALKEMRRLLGHLREDGGDVEAGATLRELERLIETARQAGAEVALEVRGAPVALPPAIDVSAYRIVQEGLTNARRHAEGAACAVTVGYEPDTVSIYVRNDRAREVAHAASPGYGLVGVHERVNALGGALDVGPAPDGGWQLRAHLPLDRA